MLANVFQPWIVSPQLEQKNKANVEKDSFFIFILKANPEPCIFISFQSSCPESPPPADEHHSQPFCLFPTNMLMIWQSFGGNPIHFANHIALLIDIVTTFYAFYKSHGWGVGKWEYNLVFLMCVFKLFLFSNFFDFHFLLQQMVCCRVYP